MTVSFNGRMDAMYQDLNGKFEALSTHVKKLDVQVAQSAESIKRQEGFLPGKTNINPKHSCHAIMVETGANFVDFEKTATDFRTAEVVSGDTTELCRSTLHIGCRSTPSLCRSTPVTARRNSANFGFSGKFLQIPDCTRSYRNVQISAIIQNKIPEKLPDPGNFVLDCSISTSRFPHSLCDLGSSVNLMPLSVAARLGMTDFKPTRISLIMADRSKRIPQGVLENVPLKIEGKRSVPPKLTSHPAAIPHFLGRPHAPNAYTPPWMRRHSSQRHLLLLSDPPDA
ncbi:unnamed protein product [Microthlaspi erraticum]|uniref:Retrotransposon gag domain-containing protein n=1 Tax=Microthlaspi erraticum TaxID=1685480 RepID=A0A6D2I4J7_9BRAS|nr:unnamed protein product [Microthlaspi erraticum]